MALRQERLFGQICLRKRLVTPAQLEEGLAAQKSASAGAIGDPIGEILVRKGFLMEAQVKEVLLEQSFERTFDTGQTFGAIAVQLGGISEGQALEALKRMKTHFQERKEIKRLDDELVEMGALTPRELARIHAAVESGRYHGTNETTRLTRTFQENTKTGQYPVVTAAVSHEAVESSSALKSQATAPGSSAALAATPVQVQVHEVESGAGMPVFAIAVTALLLVALGAVAYLYSSLEERVADAEAIKQKEIDSQLSTIQELVADKKKLDDEFAALQKKASQLQQEFSSAGTAGSAKDQQIRDLTRQRDEEKRRREQAERERDQMKQELREAQRRVETSTAAPPAVVVAPPRRVVVSVVFGDPPESLSSSDVLKKAVSVGNARYDVDSDLVVFTAKFDPDKYEGAGLPLIEIVPYVGESPLAPVTWRDWPAEGVSDDIEVPLRLAGTEVTRIACLIKD